VHAGIEDRLWHGFEERVRSRRFYFLIAQADHAFGIGDLEVTEHALDEARGLNASAPAVLRLDAQLAERRRTEKRLRVVRGLTAAAALVLLVVSLSLGLDRALRVVPASEAPMITVGEPDSAASVRKELAARAFMPYARGLFIPPIRERRPDIRTTAPLTTVALRRASRLDDRVEALPARTESVSRSPATPSEVISSSGASSATAEGERDSGAGIPTTTVDVPRPSSAPEADSSMPGASVALLLADAATRVAASSTSSGAAQSLTQLAVVLRGYADALRAADVLATRQLWPNVDERTLEDTFSSQPARHISLDACDINVQGTAATASCHGNATSARTEPSLEARVWRFDLRRAGETWKIENAETMTR
jgi:hypothetical protein